MTQLKKLLRLAGISRILLAFLSMSASFAQALPVMQPGEWRVRVSGELVDNKTGKRTPAGANTTILLCLTKSFLDNYGLAGYSINAQKAGLKNTDTTKCRSAVSEMTASSVAYQFVCGRPDNQSSTTDFQMTADATSFRTTTLTTRSDGTGAIEATNEANYVGECQDERMARLLPPTQHVVPNPLPEIQTVELDGDTFHLAEISDTTVAYENAFALKGESVKKFSKYFAVMAFRGGSIANYLQPQLDNAKRNKAQGAPDPSSRKLGDGRYLLEFIRRFDDRHIELYLMVVQPGPEYDLKVTMYTQRFTGSYANLKAEVQSKAARVSKQLVNLDLPIMMHAKISAPK